MLQCSQDEGRAIYDDYLVQVFESTADWWLWQLVGPVPYHIKYQGLGLDILS